MYSQKRGFKKKQKKRNTLLIVAIVSVFFISLLLRSVVMFPSVQAVSDIRNVRITNTTNIPWPQYGQAAVGVKDYGVVASTENQQVAPMASVAKLVTALAILEKKPLSLGDQGADIIVNDADIAIYDYYLQRQGVVVDIKPGQTLSEYKALQYMLILSANNIADITAKWAFGSNDAYIAYANNMLKQYGLQHIHVADASGMSPSTVATSADLVRLGEKALHNPIIAQIVAQETIALPDGTEKINTNVFLNYEGNGVIGIKNGLTDEAGGVLLAAANRTINDKQIVIISVVMGSPKYFDSQKDAVGLIDPTLQALQQPARVEAGERIGHYTVPWLGDVAIVTKDSIELGSWTNVLDSASLHVEPATKTFQKDDSVGSITVLDTVGNKKDYQVVVESAIESPSLKWRFANAF